MAPGILLPERDSSPASTASSTSSSPTNSSATTSLAISDVTTSRRRRLLRRSIRNPPLLLKRADGNWQWVSDGQKTWKVFDASGGAGVSIIGHNDERVYAAMEKHRKTTGIAYAPASTYDTDIVRECADYLIESTDLQMAEVAFYGSGSEAVEASKKFAFQYHACLKQNPEPDRRWFIARERSYHGATLGALDISGHTVRRELYENILPRNTRFIPPCNPYRDKREGETEDQYIERLAGQLESMIHEIGTNKVAGFYMEPVVGAALGCVPALPGYMKAMKSVCRKYGVLFILDEVMCGMGRTGHLHAWQEENVVPDIQLVGKGLGGGYAAISAMLIGHELADALGENAFAHGHTFQNFPQACAAALAVMKIIFDDNLLENVKAKGQELMKRLLVRLGDHPHVGDIRGVGHFLGIEFVRNKKSKAPFDADVAVATRIHEQGLRDGYNIYVYPGSGTVNGKEGDHITIAPAYNITHADLDIIVNSVTKLIEDFFESLPASQK